MTARIGMPQQCRSMPMKGPGGMPVGKKVGGPPDGCCSCCLQMIYVGHNVNACGIVPNCSQSDGGATAGANLICEEIPLSDGDVCPSPYTITRTVRTFGNPVCNLDNVTFTVVAHDTGGAFITAYDDGERSAFICMRLVARPHALGSCDTGERFLYRQKTGFDFPCQILLPGCGSATSLLFAGCCCNLCERSGDSCGHP